jgi:hypothetical protein
MNKSVMSRRMVLRGLGTAIGLPLFDAMVPMLDFTPGLKAAAPAPEIPRRLVYIYVPNGVHMQSWTPKTEGALVGDLPSTLAELAPLRDKMIVFSGLTADKARANGDGPGDHARAMSSFLTGKQARKTPGADIRIGISADQVVAQKVGHLTKFPSLEIGIERGLNSGGCDSGYSCAYSANMAWRSESTPVPKEIDPKAIFERLFADPKQELAELAKRTQSRKSVLDLAMEDARQLERTLGGSDKRKLDEYLTSIRDVEVRLAKSGSGKSFPEVHPPKGVSKPTGIPPEYGAHIRLMADMLCLALQADLTRVSTFAFANEGSNRSYKFMDVPEGHHDLSHHGRDKAKQAKIEKINRFHISQLSHFLNGLAKVQENGKSLLDSSMVCFGSGISDGDAHNHDELPILVVGGGGGTIKGGRHVRVARETPLTNLHLAFIERMGAKTDKLGDSTGILTPLS